MDSSRRVIGWCLILVQLKDVILTCDIDHCNLDYCSGEGCLLCSDGYYLAGTTCSQCQPSCTKCVNNTICTECIPRRHGTACENECKRECAACEGVSQCTQCIPGRHGSTCHLYCPLSCLDILCDKDTGKCTRGCRHGYYRSGGDCQRCPEHCTRCTDNSECTSCNDGYYGTLCESNCPNNCKNQKCDKLLGHCTDGCTVGYFLDGLTCSRCPQACGDCDDLKTCMTCKTGYWGQLCEHECPFDCDMCNERGHCIDDPDCNIEGCARGYCSGNSCIKCDDRFYLEDSLCYPCPSYCTKCATPSDCTQCALGLYGPLCESSCPSTCYACRNSTECSECIPGRYGSYCQSYCPFGCLDLLCSKDRGKCTEGCRHGYFTRGDECNHCPDHCVRCTNESYCTACSSGYYGSYCQYSCPASCLNQLCDKDLGYCTDGCITGYYVDGNTCSACPDQCTSCLDGTTCTECKSGYWGSACQLNCPVTCNRCTKEGQCLLDSDCRIFGCDTAFCSGSSCIKCQDGFYLSGTVCNQCPLGCTSCTGPSMCTACPRGKYGTTCDHTCRYSCLDCVSGSQCTECIPGRYGDYCQLNCPLGCLDMVCDKTIGVCLKGCRHGYYLSGEDCTQCPDQCTRCTDSNQCTLCISGYYGRNCQDVCASSCRNLHCEKELGTCLEGCVEGYFLDDNTCISCPPRCNSCDDWFTCSACKTGFWGYQCREDCPNTCVRCAVEDGQCLSDPECDIDHCNPGYCADTSCIHCEDGFHLLGSHCYECQPFCTKCLEPSVCTECVPGRYGPDCDYTCSAACIDCTSSSQCMACIHGRYGPYCQFYCPLGCIDILCEKDTGQCTKGCRHGYYHNEDECLECPDNCERCTDSDPCTKCSSGYYGSVCQYSCDPSCLNKLCDKQYGDCIEGCADGYYGNIDSCQRCPDWCEKCETRSECTGCRVGYWGSQCQHECPAGCIACSIQGICKDDGGVVCNIGHCEPALCFERGCLMCKDGYFLSGTHCYECGADCTKCSGPSTCSECLPGRYGPQCEYKCSNLCPDCTSSSHCIECIPGRYGTSCQSLCQIGCKSIICDKETGGCMDGCRKGYYLSGGNCIPCSEQCEYCSDSGHCSVCNLGYYGSSCQMTCPEGCKDQICHKDLGYCTEGCAEGYYFEGHCKECPDSCLSCTDGNTCIDCKAGYWGSHCQHHCPGNCYRCIDQGHCIDEIGPDCYISDCDREYCYGSGCTRCQEGYFLYQTNCFRCPSNCITCSSEFTCTKCVQGRYGNTCENICDNTCIDCVSSTQCISCIPGRFGSRCEITCPLACKDITCEQISGKCMEGCRAGYYLSEDVCMPCPDDCTKCLNSSYCIECEPGQYGSVCEQLCHEGCKDHLCHIVTGNCTLGCTIGYHNHRSYCVPDEVPSDCLDPNCAEENCFGSECTYCKDGYYLDAYQCHKCPVFCTKCSSNTQCKECKLGRHGQICESNCSVSCRDYVCTKDFGFCTEGCNDGYTMVGGYCIDCPRNCISCSSMELCTKCRVGSWGDICQFDCLGCNTTGCQQNIHCTHGCGDGYYVQIFDSQHYSCVSCPEGCQKCTDSTSCITCEVGHWGTNCSYRCNSNCRERSCSKDGQCNRGCENGYYGSTCSERCPEGCDSCLTKKTCIACITGRFGSMCDQSCNLNCFRDACDRDNGTCLYGCDVGYSGDMCEQEDEMTSCDGIGVSVGLGVLLGIELLVIGVLALILFRSRISREPERDLSPAMMNKTYDTRIGTDFFQNVKVKNDPYDNRAGSLPSIEDKPSPSNSAICRYPSLSNKEFDKTYEEETEYSIIRTSNDNIHLSGH